MSAVVCEGGRTKNEEPRTTNEEPRTMNYELRTMNEVPRTKNEELRTKSGVAIILVLGMLALLMIMATTFSITMRVERTGAGGFVHNIKAENLVWAGIARAIDDIDANMVGADAMYPTTWQTLTSGSGSGVSMAWGEALDYIPDAFGTLPGAGWTNIATGGGNVANVAYLVLNCSGFLDINTNYFQYIDGSTNRTAGVSPKEIQIGGFPSIKSAADLDTQRTTTDKRYETLKEFADLQYDVGLRTNIPPDYFVTYSRYPNGYLDGTNLLTNVVYLGGDRSDLETRANEIISALDDAVIGATLEDAGFVFTNLLDYIDSDCIPTDLGTACTELVPMINEVFSRMRITKTGNIGQLDSRISVEWFFPFVKPSPYSFDLFIELNTRVERTTGGGSPEELANVTEFATISTTYDPDISTQFYDNIYFRPTDSPHNFSPITFPATNNSISVTQEVKCIVRPSSGLYSGQDVDSVPFPFTDPGIGFLADFGVVAGTVSTNFVSRECIDPRYNWDTGSVSWKDNTNDSHTLNSQNSYTTKVMDRGEAARNRGYDSDTSMYVSDSNELFSVGELGNLLRDSSPGAARAFKTIRLYDYVGATTTERDNVLEHFTLSTSTVQRGLANLNVLSSYVKEAVFKNQPFPYPGSGISLQITDVNNILNYINTRRANTCFTNVADIGDDDWKDIAGFGDYSDLELESMITYSSGLLGTRQNLFTIIVEANPSSLGMGAHAAETERVEWSPTKRAVVQVWRDPFEDAEGQHKTFIQSFRWLTDD